MSTRFAAIMIAIVGVAAALSGFYLASQPTPTRASLAAMELPVYGSESSTSRKDGPGHRSGNLVVLDFWASWCTPCHVQSRLLGNMVEDYAPRGVHFFAVNVGESASVIAASLGEHPIDFPVLMDEDGAKSSAAEVFGLPTLVILDRDGNEALRRVGLTSARFLRDTLDALLASESEVQLATSSDRRVPLTVASGSVGG